MIVSRLCAVLVAVAVATLAFPATSAQAQRVGSVPRDVALDVTRVFNTGTTRKVRGDFTLGVGDTVRSDLAILNGNARLAGVVSGDVVVLNG
ncbi:MAG: hypothetical protein EBV77_08380, partial [Gemmatimonadaceae bacterium]|nr:hypothetical protein [Gemmatimonadaceae bacterium]